MSKGSKEVLHLVQKLIRLVGLQISSVKVLSIDENIERATMLKHLIPYQIKFQFKYEKIFLIIKCQI